jgi:hypothetical protein
MGGKGESKVSLRKGGDFASKSRGHKRSGRWVSFDRNESAFVEINVEPSGHREIIQESFKVSNMVRDGSNDNEGVISILEDGTREIIDKRVKEKTFTRGVEQELLKDIHNNVEEERGKRVTLTKPPLALNPASGDSIQKNRSLTRVIEHLNPIPPKVGKPFCLKNTIQRIPTNRVKGFAEIQFEHNGRSRSFVTRLDNVRCIDKIFSNRPSRDKPSLIRMNQKRNELAQSKRETFCMEFKAAVL